MGREFRVGNAFIWKRSSGVGHTTIESYHALLQIIALSGAWLCIKSYSGWNTCVDLHTIHRTQGPRRDSRSPEAKKVLNVLENDTKANFQENIPDKVRFQKKLWGHGPSAPLRQGGLEPNHEVTV